MSRYCAFCVDRPGEKTLPKYGAALFCGRCHAFHVQHGRFPSSADGGPSFNLFSAQPCLGHVQAAPRLDELDQGLAAHYPVVRFAGEED